MPTDHTPTPEPAPRTPATGGTPVLAFLALLVATLTAAYVIYRDPPWGRLGKYDFSTPEQALRSESRMRANGDIPAMIELESRLDRKEEKERLATLEIKRTAEFRGKTALFVQYKRTDKGSKKEVVRREVMWYEKEEGSGYWRQTSVSSTDLRKGNEKLARDIDAWGNGEGVTGSLSE